MEAKRLLDVPSALAAAPRPPIRISSLVEATLPLPVSQKWVAHACRMAGVGKPRWDRHTALWTTSGKRPNGEVESIVIRHGASPKSIRIEVSWLGTEATPTETATARRLVTSLFTGMQWALRHEKRTRALFV